MKGFAIVGCSKCRRIMVADLSHDTKTCQCGQKLQLCRTKLFAVFDDAESAAVAVQKLQEQKNTGFSKATTYTARKKSNELI